MSSESRQIDRFDGKFNFTPWKATMQIVLLEKDSLMFVGLNSEQDQQASTIIFLVLTLAAVASTIW